MVKIIITTIEEEDAMFTQSRQMMIGLLGLALAGGGTAELPTF